MAMRDLIILRMSGRKKERRHGGNHHDIHVLIVVVVTAVAEMRADEKPRLEHIHLSCYYIFGVRKKMRKILM